jgi:hypothetical protein
VANQIEFEGTRHIGQLARRAAPGTRNPTRSHTATIAADARM